MKGYKDITYKYLKAQKKRTLLTIFGIILSIALITAIGTMIVSVRDAQIKDVIKREGENHAVIKDVSKEDVDSIVDNVKVEKAGIGKSEGFGIVRELTEREKDICYDMCSYRYLNINAYDEKALSLLPYKIKEGRFPKGPNEIVIEDWMVDYFPEEVKIGGKIKLPIGERYLLDEQGNETMKADLNDKSQYGEIFKQTGEKEYIVVGLLKSDYVYDGKFITNAITYLDKDSLSDEYNIYLKMNSLKNIHDEVYKMAGIDDYKNSEDVQSVKKVEFNEKLLGLSAKSLDSCLNRTLIILLLFIVGLIIIATVAVIYNAFNISILERISQFGLLRTVGATPKQIKGIVMKEAALLSVIGIPIGLVCGVLAMKIVLYIIGLLKFNAFRDLQVTYSISVYIIGTVLGIITVFLSAYGPAKKAAKVSPLEAVRSTGNYKKEDLKKVRSSKLIRSTLGTEGEIAYKNLRRNRKRFIITVFSMVISIALYITFSSFSDYIFKIGAVNYEEVGDFRLSNDFDFKDLDSMDAVYNDLNDMKDIKRVYKLRGSTEEVLLREEKINPKLKELEPNLQELEKEGDFVLTYNNEMMTFGNDNMKYLKPLLKEGNIDIDVMNRENGVLVVTTTRAWNTETERSVIIDGYDIKVGDELTIVKRDNATGDETSKKKVKVMGVLDKGLLDREHNPNGAFNIITTEEVFEEIEENGPTNLVIEMKNDGNKEVVKKYLDKLKESNKGFNYIDYSEIAKENRKAGIVMNIFLYGFVAVITLISSINIINTISTNLILRTRELAMIKAVGMSQGGVKRMVALESLYYGIYAAIYGGLVGTGLSFVMYKIILRLSEFEWTIPWKNIFIACAGATLIALVSGIIPLKRINSGNIVEKIKMEE